MRGRRIVLPIAATVAIVATLGWFWLGSLVPASYSAAAMGTPDHGGGPRDPRSSGHDHQRPAGRATARMITELTADQRRAPDVAVDLVTRSGPVPIAGRQAAGFTVNGTTPGPTIRARHGQLVEVRLRNESVAAGVALHWHGLDVPNAMDGVAGVTQDAVPVGGRFTYRFVADRVGTYWYHSHQVSNPQVAGGLFGALVVTPETVTPSTIPRNPEVIAAAHTYAGIRTVNGRAEDLRVSVAPGTAVRIRLINTDNAAMEVWASTPYRVLATDGTEVHRPGRVQDRSLTLTAGGRVDLEVAAPSDGLAARVQLSQATAVLVGSGAAPAAPPRPTAELDLLAYGTPTPLPFDTARPDRRFDYVVDRRPGFVRGRPGMWWAINGQLYPHVPMFVVREGDVAVMRIVNHSGEPHPMHLHGHHVLVLSRNGVPATGSRWWVDSLHVAPGETYEIAFVAANPGIWMDHCHNLTHAEEGMVAHLMYEGWDTPFRIGGPAANQPD